MIRIIIRKAASERRNDVSLDVYIYYQDSIEHNLHIILKVYDHLLHGEIDKIVARNCGIGCSAYSTNRCLNSFVLKGIYMFNCIAVLYRILP